MQVDFSQKEYYVQSLCGGGYHTESEREGAHNQAGKTGRLTGTSGFREGIRTTKSVGE